MKDNEMDEFSWSSLFFVTCVCSFVFTGIIKMLDGGISLFFLLVGTAAFTLWMVNRIGSVMSRMNSKKRKTKESVAPDIS